MKYAGRVRRVISISFPRERDVVRFKVEVMDELWESSNIFSF